MHIFAINGHKNKYPLTYMSFSPFFQDAVGGEEGSYVMSHTAGVYLVK